MSGEDDEGAGWSDVHAAVGYEEYVCGRYVLLLLFYRVPSVERPSNTTTTTCLSVF